MGSGSPATSTAARRVDHHSFVGTPREVATGLYALPSSLVRRTFYALLLEGDGQAEIRIHERAAEGDREGRVTVWEGVSLGDLCDRVAAGCADPAGSSSDSPVRGEPVAAVVELLHGHGDFTDMGSVPAPPTARGAFGHPMRRYAHDHLVRAVVVAGERSG